MEWPPCSLDLTSMDFFMGLVVKNTVYERNRRTMDELKEYISKVIIKIDAN